MEQYPFEDNSVIITTKEEKEHLIDNFSRTPNLVTYQVLAVEELEEGLFGTYDAKTIAYLMDTKSYPYEVAKMYLDHIKYIFLNQSELSSLTALKDELESHDLWLRDPLFEKKLEGKAIYFYHLSFSKWNQFLLTRVHGTWIEEGEEQREEPYPLYQTETFEEAVATLASKICFLVHRGTSLHEIAIYHVFFEDEITLERMLKLFHIPLAKETISFGELDYAKKFLEALRQHSVEESVASLDPTHPYYQTLLDCVNSLAFIDCQKKTYLTLLREQFAKKQVTLHARKEGVQVLPIGKILKDTKYAFILNVNQNYFPTYKRDEDYLSDSLREKIGLDTSYEENVLLEKHYRSFLTKVSNPILFVADRKGKETLYPASILASLSLVAQKMGPPYSYSHLYNQLELAKKLDIYHKYHEADPHLSLLAKTYPQLSYRTYQNQFTPVSVELPKRMILSYSSLSHFYQCAFRFYLERVLKISRYEESFQAYLGSLFHKILSVAFEDSFDFEREWNAYLQLRSLSSKEKFLLRRLKKELLALLDIVRKQEQVTSFSQKARERELFYPIDAEGRFLLKGMVDKILYQEKEGKTYFAIIDYKTGRIPDNMENMVYGLDMQLGVYLTLVLSSNLFSDPRPTGFYFQKILFTDREKKEYRFQGYSLDTLDVLEEFDPTFANSELIKSMKWSVKGFGPYTKLFSDKDVQAITTLVKEKVNEAVLEIRKGQFMINPKIIGKENVACTYCPYQDICYRTERDVVYLGKQAKGSFLGKEEDYAEVDD